MTIRVAVIGAGYFASFHINAWLRLPFVELTTVIEPDTTKHSALRTKLNTSGSPQTIITDTTMTLEPSMVDLIDIATPPHTHAALITECIALQSRCIICQKPFCGSLQNAQEVQKLIDNSNTTVVVHENFRFQPWYRELKKQIDNNHLGDILQASFRLRPGDGQGDNAYLARQPYFRNMKQFLIHETGVHFIDVFRYLFGEPQAVSADLGRLNPAISGEDFGHFIFYYDSGQRAHFDGNRLLDHPADNTRLTMGELLIEGTEGSLSLSGSGKILLRKFGSKNWQTVQYAFEDTDFGGDCVYQLQKHVVEHLQTQSLLENDAASYLKNLQIERLIYQSASEHRQLQIPSGNTL